MKTNECTTLEYMISIFPYSEDFSKVSMMIDFLEQPQTFREYANFFLWLSGELTPELATTEFRNLVKSKLGLCLGSARLLSIWMQRVAKRL